MRPLVWAGAKSGDLMLPQLGEPTPRASHDGSHSKYIAAAALFSALAAFV